MINLTVLVNQLLQLFIIICAGYIVYKVHILNDVVNKHLNAFVINVTLPLMIISSVLSLKEHPKADTLASLFQVSIGFYILMPLLAFFIVKIMLKTMKIVKVRQGVYMFMLIFSNVGFMGMPILKAACGSNGDTAVFYAAILNIFFNLGVFTYGVALIGYGEDVDTTFKLKTLISPGILCAIIALIIYGFNLHFPATIENAMDTIGGLTPPLAMILVGSTLASMKIKEVFNNWRIYIFAVIKQIVLPVLLYPLFRFLISDNLLFNVMFIEFLMPVANVALMLSTEYDLDYKFVSKTIFLSTILSLFSIPLVLYICNILY